MPKYQLKKRSFPEDAYGILKPMKGGKKAHGFTVVETLIVLAVTGALFVAVAATLSGRQAKTQFTQGIQEIQSQIQQVINDVGSGYFPSSNNFSCVSALSGPSISTGTNEQGSNEGCIFLGKAIQFGVDSTDPEEFNIFTIAGLQRTPTGEEVSSSDTSKPPYDEAKPIAVAPPASPRDLTDKQKLRYGLTTLQPYFGVSKTPISSVAFVNSLAAYSGGTITSGSQQVRVVPIPGNWHQTESQAATDINNKLRTSNDVDPDGGVSICFVSGTTDQSGLITIGNSGRQLSVTLSIKGNKTCS